MDKWINYFIENETSCNRIAFFEKEIIPSLPSLQQKINNNEIFNYLNRTNPQDQSGVDIWLGEVPLPVIWEYYKNKKQIDDDEYKCLEKALQNNPLLNGRIPVMILDTGSDYQEVNDKDYDFAKIEIISGRKFIQTND